MGGGRPPFKPPEIIPHPTLGLSQRAARGQARVEQPATTLDPVEERPGTTFDPAPELLDPANELDPCLGALRGREGDHVTLAREQLQRSRVQRGLGGLAPELDECDTAIRDEVVDVELELEPEPQVVLPEEPRRRLRGSRKEVD